MLSANCEISSSSNCVLALLAWIQLDVTPALGSDTLGCTGAAVGAEAAEPCPSLGDHSSTRTETKTLPPQSQPALAPPGEWHRQAARRESLQGSISQLSVL